MSKGVLINDIELGYAPLSAYHFSKLLTDKEFIENFEDCHLYIIAQRQELTFNNFDFSSVFELRFEIRQENNPNIIKCVLPVFQKNIATDRSKGVDIRLHNRKNTIEKKSTPPFDGTQGFTLKEVNVITGELKHLIWLTPEKFLHCYWKGYIKANIKGDYKRMLEYKVHYVGKSTEQNICQRLSNHATFQEILSKQDVLTYGNIPSNEIVILLLRIKDNNTIVKWDDETGKEMADYMLNYTLPSDRKVSLDAEKALIKHLKPEYNKILYKTFPNKDDLVYRDFHNLILYSFVDPIKLIYDNGCIKGGDWGDEKDYIEVGK